MSLRISTVDIESQTVQNALSKLSDNIAANTNEIRELKESIKSLTRSFDQLKAQHACDEDKQPELKSSILSEFKRLENKVSEAAKEVIDALTPVRTNNRIQIVRTPYTMGQLIQMRAERHPRSPSWEHGSLSEILERNS
jgi:protein subunit release factor A